MTTAKTAVWLNTLVGLLFVLAGIRDLFAPGFFSISGRPVNSRDAGVNIAIGIVFIVLGSLYASKKSNLKKQD